MPEIKNRFKPSKLWLFLITIRVVLNLFSQRSYIHPDEFFQGVEIIAGDLFECSDKVFRAWEFQLNDQQEPIRNMAIPYLFYGIPLYVLKFLSNLGAVMDYTKNPNRLTDMNIISVQANTLIYYPRLFMTIYSFIIDLCLYKIATLCQFDQESVLLTFASSYITNVYLTRTFSNSIETILFTILVYFIIKSIKKQHVLDEKFLVESQDGNPKNVISSNTNEFKINKTSPKSKNTVIKRFKLFDIYKYNYMSSWIGICLSFGVFNRPTFLIYAFIPLLFWTLNGLNSCNFRQFFKYSLKRVMSVAKYFLPFSIMLSLFDTIYFYKIDSLIELIYHLKTSKLILTPFNFFLYNSNSNNLKQHGEHAIYQHLINCFLLFGINHIILFFICVKFCTKINHTESLDLSSVESIYKRKILVLKYKFLFYFNLIISNLFCYFIFSFIVPLVVFSLVSHKEPRFLLPLLVPISLLTGHTLFGKDSSKFLRFIWYLFNFVALIIYGYLHQGGVLASLSHVQKMSTHVSNLDLDQHVIFYHTYMPPRYLVQAPVYANLINNKRYIYESQNKGQKAVRPVREVYDLMSSSNKKAIEQLINEIQNNYKKDKKSVSKSYSIFVVAPSVLDYELTSDETCNLTKYNNDKSVEETNTNIGYHLISKFKFHITFEHLSEHIDFLKCKFGVLTNANLKYKENLVCQINKCKKMSLVKRLLDSFSLNLYQIIL